MKKIKLFAAAFAVVMMMSCGGAKQETSLEKFERLVNECVDAMNSGDVDKAGRIYDEVNALSPEIEEIGKNGTPEEIAKIKEINEKYASAFNKEQ